MPTSPFTIVRSANPYQLAVLKQLIPPTTISSPTHNNTANSAANPTPRPTATDTGLLDAAAAPEKIGLLLLVGVTPVVVCTAVGGAVGSGRPSRPGVGGRRRLDDEHAASEDVDETHGRYRQWRLISTDWISSKRVRGWIKP